MKLLLFATLCTMVPLSMAGGDSVDDFIMEVLDTCNLLTQCWGKEYIVEYMKEIDQYSKECGIDAAPVQEALVAGKPLLGRKRRQAPEDEVENFLQMHQQYKDIEEESTKGVMCVFQKFGFIDAEGKVKLESITKGIEDTKADADFKKSMIVGMEDCHKVAQNWPKQMFERYHLEEDVARAHIFFACGKKIEHRLCYLKEAYEIQEIFYGKMDDIDHEAYGFPKDKYEAAYEAMRAEVVAGSSAKLSLHEALFGRARFL